MVELLSMDDIRDYDRETLTKCASVARRAADFLDRAAKETDPVQLAAMLHRAIYNLDESGRAARGVYLWLDSPGIANDDNVPEGEEGIQTSDG